MNRILIVAAALTIFSGMAFADNEQQTKKEIQEEFQAEKENKGADKKEADQKNLTRDVDKLKGEEE